MDLPEVCTIAELARASKVLSPRDIKEDCKAGRITHYKRKSKIFIDRDDALEYLKSLKCPRKTPDTDLNGVKNAMSGKSSGLNKAGENASQRAQQTAKKLIKSSSGISKAHNVVQLRG